MMELVPEDIEKIVLVKISILLELLQEIIKHIKLNVFLILLQNLLHKVNNLNNNQITKEKQLYWEEKEVMLVQLLNKRMKKKVFFNL